MKKVLRVLTFILCHVLVVCSIPQAVLAQVGELLDVGETEASEAVSPNVYVLGEVIDSRTETTKTFRLSDGSYIAADYGKAVHYAGENGKWMDYDNTLSFSEASSSDSEDTAGYCNNSADLRIKLAKNSNSSNLLKLTFGNYKVGMHLTNAAKSRAVELYPVLEEPIGNDPESATALHRFTSGAIYEEILPDVDLEYIISGGSVKENIIIKDTAEEYVYIFELKLHGLFPAVDADGSIRLQDETTGETKLVIPAGYMYDANGACSDAVSYSIAHKNGKKYTFTVTADAAWINAAERAFPVTVDPTVEAFGGTSTTFDNYISENDPDSENVISGNLVAGYHNRDTSLEWHTLLKPQALPVLPESAAVVAAYIQLQQIDTGVPSVNLAAVPITSAWNTDTVTWNTKPSYGTDILDYVSLSEATENTTVSFDITRLAQEWYNGSACHGVALIPLAGNGTGHVYFASSDSNPETYVHPQMLISYRDTKGLEGIWTYSSHSAGAAGAGYVNGFNGNLVFVHNDMTAEGSILPVAVSHVYNSYQAGKEFTADASDVNAPVTTVNNSVLAGKGWKLSVQETLVPRTVGNTLWYVYNDADGTELYFFHGETMADGVYKSEDGYGLIVTVNSDGSVTLADDYGNTKLFVNGVLREIADVYGNVKQIVYSADRMQSVRYRPAGETVYTTQIAFAYNEANALIRISNAYNIDEYVTLCYSETYNGTYSTEYAGYLRKIEYSLGGYTLFAYNSDGTLAAVTDGDTNYQVAYDYVTYHGNKRVSAVTESVGTTVGQKVGFSYANKQFTVRTSGVDDSYGTADDILTVALFDHFGKAVCSYSTDVAGSAVYGASYAEYTVYESGEKTNNKLKTDAVKGMTEENFVRYGNAEFLTGWSNSTDGTGYSAAYSTAESYAGGGSLKLSSTDGGGGAAWLSTSVTVPAAGTYTLSAYVKVTGMTAGAGGGAAMILDNTQSELIASVTNGSVDGGWRRISVTKTLTAGTKYIDLYLSNATGTVYVDCIQLESADLPSDYNYLYNGSLRGGTGWTGTFSTLSAEASRGHVGVLTGTQTAQKRASQTVQIGAGIKTAFMLTGWAKANSADLLPTDQVPQSEEPSELAKANRKFGMLATLTYSDGTTEEQYVSFNPDITVWQYAALAIVPQKTDESLTVTAITVSAVYDYNANTMYFDDLCLTVEPAQTYAYDENGKLESTSDTKGNESLLEYAANGVDLQSYTTVTGDEYTYTYKTVNGVNTHDVETVVRTAGNATQTLTYGYDAYGNVTSSELTASGTAETVKSTATYTEYGNYLASITDSLGNVTSYDYDSVTKLLNFIQDANGNRTAYKYDTRQRTTDIYLDADEDGVPDTDEPSVAYLYANNRLSGITTATTAYTLTYDAFGNVLSIKLGSIAIATYTYAANNGKLTKLTYGTGDYESYTYDHLDRLVAVTYNGSATSGYELLYDANGRLYSTVDRESGITHIYEYDSLNRLIRAWQKKTSTGELILGVENSYDQYGRASGSTYEIGDTAQSYDITYEETSNLIEKYTTPGNTFNYTYDEFDRLYTKRDAVQTITYNYVSGSQRISAYAIYQAVGSYVRYTFEYDNLGNITSIAKNGTTVSNYEYDALGRLIREDDCANDVAYVYTYDDAGNLLRKYKFSDTGYTASYWMSTSPTIENIVSNYVYNNSSAWGDLLTNYNGTTITYDAIGNPSKWHNAEQLGWEGRKLVRANFADDTFLYFNYNADGIRTKKYKTDADGIIYSIDYVLDGNTVLKETKTDHYGETIHTMYYYYDESGISGLSYNGTKYSYVKNLQGDVIGIINENGATVVSYTYDAWGNVLSVTGSMAATLGAANPFRYRGYYYDTETGFYYLNSRYYDPQVGRFLNADAYISTGQGILGYNMFAYCNDNPVMYGDENGDIPFKEKNPYPVNYGGNGYKLVDGESDGYTGYGHSSEALLEHIINDYVYLDATSTVSIHVKYAGTYIPSTLSEDILNTIGVLGTAAPLIPVVRDYAYVTKFFEFVGYYSSLKTVYSMATDTPQNSQYPMYIATFEWKRVYELENFSGIWNCTNYQMEIFYIWNNAVPESPYWEVIDYSLISSTDTYSFH